LITTLIATNNRASSELPKKELGWIKLAAASIYLLRVGINNMLSRQNRPVHAKLKYNQ
jgi:hypothetical protein